MHVQNTPRAIDKQISLFKKEKGIRLRFKGNKQGPWLSLVKALDAQIMIWAGDADNETGFPGYRQKPRDPRFKSGWAHYVSFFLKLVHYLMIIGSIPSY